MNENLRQVYNLLKKQVNKDFEEIGITFSQSNVLMFIINNKNRKINQRDIEKEFNLTNPTINGILNRLESKGFITRINNENDKRIKNIVALEKTERFIDQVKKRKQILENIMLKNINDEDLNNFQKVLETIIINLKENINERNI